MQQSIDVRERNLESTTSAPQEPMRIIEEAIRLEALALRAKIEALPGDIVSELPGLFGLKASFASAAQGFVQVRLAPSLKQPTWIPEGKSLVIGANTIPFVTVQSMCCVPGGPEDLDCTLVTDLQHGHFYIEVSQFECLKEKQGEEWLHLFVDLERPQMESGRIIFEVFEKNQWVSISAKDGTHGLRESGFIAFDPKNHSIPLSEVGGRRGAWVRCTPSTPHGLQHLRAVRFNVLPVLNAVTYGRHCLGSGNGLANQQFMLPHGQPMGAFELEVEGPLRSEPQIWSEMFSFFLSTPESRHYQLDRGAGSVHFGDGVRGKVAPPGFDNIWIKGLQICHGSSGNLQRNASVTFGKDLWQVAGAALVSDCTGGLDAVTKRDLINGMHAALANRDRAVVAKDYIDIVQRYHPEIGQVFVQANSGAVVRVIPLAKFVYAKDRVTLDLTPSPKQLEAIRVTLEERRMVNVRVEVVPAKLCDIEIHALVSVRDIGVGIQEELEKVLREWLAAEMHPGMILKADMIESVLLGAGVVRQVKMVRLVTSETLVASQLLALEKDSCARVHFHLRLEGNGVAQ